MSELRRQFVSSSVENLQNLRREIESAESFSAELVREIFRRVHTVKGTAQTFGFENAGLLAHELESFLSGAKNGEDILEKEILLESLDALIKSFEEKDSENPRDLIKKIKTASAKPHSVGVLPELPEKFSNSLSNQEKNAVLEALAHGKKIFCLEVFFETANFGIELLKFRKLLEEKGEAAAMFPGEKTGSKKGFGFLFTGNVSRETLSESIADFQAEIVFETSENDLTEILEELKNHGEKLAEKSGKKVLFEISAGKISLSADITKIIFDAVLHLVRNAVDHAIETPKVRIEKGKTETGQIEIRILKEKNILKIILTDDGRGIDAEAVESEAIRKNLISKNEELSSQEKINLIFTPGFSTAENLSETSGRGVGLDAVKEIVESAGGKILVKSEKDAGTSFEIILPLENLK